MLVMSDFNCFADFRFRYLNGEHGLSSVLRHDSRYARPQRCLTPSFDLKKSDAMHEKVSGMKPVSRAAENRDCNFEGVA
jgi:hypothetical protein